MSFGIIGPTGPGKRQLVGFGDRPTGRGTFGANLGSAIVTNVDFAATRPFSQMTLGRLVILAIGLSAHNGIASQYKLYLHNCSQSAT